MYNRDMNGHITSVNIDAQNTTEESFELFKSLYDKNYGTINQDGNLIDIHTGGWSDNEELIYDFKKTWWWNNNHKITINGGHYYFNTDFYSDKDWKIVKSE